LGGAEGVSEATLYGWRKDTRAAGRLMPDDAHMSAGWTSVDKFAAVVETAAWTIAAYIKTFPPQCLFRNGSLPFGDHVGGDGARSEWIPGKMSGTMKSEL